MLANDVGLDGIHASMRRRFLGTNFCFCTASIVTCLSVLSLRRGSARLCLLCCVRRILVIVGWMSSSKPTLKMPLKKMCDACR